MKRICTLMIAMLYTLACTTTLSAQDSLLFKGRWYKPMPFPKEADPQRNLLNDPDRPVYYQPGEKEQVLEAPEVDPDMPETQHTIGMPGIELDMKEKELDLPDVFTDLTPVNNLNAYPWRTIVKVFMTFNGDNYVCSGALIDSRHVLTAGHCVHDQDKGGWADEITVYPAYDAGADPFYGGSEMVNMMSWTGWTQNESWDHDMAIIELDRPVGGITGWLGIGYNTSNAFYTSNTFHNPGYPAAGPYDGQHMYYWYGNYDFVYSNNLRLYHYNEAYGGQSGSNAYHINQNGDRWSHAVLSHGSSSPGAVTGHTRMTQGKFMDIVEKIEDNTPSSNDLVPLKAYATPGTIQSGNTFDEFKFLLHNYSENAYTGSLTVSYYLSTNDFISTQDDLLGTRTFNNLNVAAKATVTLTATNIEIPAGVDPDDYYVGVILDINDFDTGNNNTEGVDTYPVTVTCGTPGTPSISASGPTSLCPGQSVTLTASNVCSGCTVRWSNGQTGNSINVSSAGTYTARNDNGCDQSGPSNSIAVTTQPGPTTPGISAQGPTTLCPGQSVTLVASNVCSGCSVSWSNGKTGNSITVSTPGSYTARSVNNCGLSSPSNSIQINTGTQPTIPTINAQGPTELCPGESVTLTASNVCSGCSVNWSNGQTDNSITVFTAGNFTAYSSNACGQSGLSNNIITTTETLPGAPTITAQGPTDFCNGESVVLMANNLCSGCTVNWSTGETGPMIIVSQAGTYTATQQNDCGPSGPSNSITTSTGNTPSAPIVTPQGPTELCNGSSLVITADNVCSNCTVNWSNGQTGSSIVVSQPGSYSATQQNDCGISTSSNAVTVTSGSAPSAPVIIAQGSTQPCPGERLVIMAENICQTCTVTWSTGEQGSQIEVDQPGSYTAWQQNDCGQSNLSNTITVEWGTLPPTPVISVLGQLCGGQSVVLAVDNPCSGCIVNWSNGQQGPSIVVNQPGSYTATQENNCGESMASAPETIASGELPSAPSVSAAGPTVLCNGQSVTLTAENVCAGCIVNWSNGQTGLSIIVTQPGSYSALAQNDCGQSQPSLPVLVETAPPFKPVVQVNNNCYLAAPNGSNYQWRLNGNDIPGANQQFWEAQETGYYTVRMDSQDACSGESDPLFAQACVSSTTEIDESLEMTLYPNPASDRVFLSLRLSESADVHIALFGTDGRMVGELHNDLVPSGNQTLELSLPNVPAGMYIYRLVSKLGHAEGLLTVQR